MSVALDLALQQDIGFVQSDAPCSREGQLNGGWSCFRARGDQYHGNPVTGRIPFSPAVGTSRLLVGGELVLDTIAIGARLGWAFRGVGPRSDAEEHASPFGVELLARVKLLESDGFRLDLLGLVGLRRMDAYAKDTVTEDPDAPPPSYQLDNPPKQTLDAYKRMGTGFVGLGLAASLSLSQATALRFELPVSLFFPSSGVALSPTLSLVVTP